jgi:hypothetical protein
VLGGESAGGIGITITANDILPTLPPAPQILLVNDAGFTLDLGQFDASVPPPYIDPAQPDAFTLSLETGLALWHGRGDVNCAAVAATPQQQVNCINTALLLQTGAIKLPTFVAESQLDTAQIPDELCPAQYGRCSVSSNPASPQGQYATAFGAAMVQNLTGANTAAAYSVTSPDKYMHVILSDAREFVAPYATPTGNTSARLQWTKWIAHPTGPRILSFADGPGVR